MKRLALFSLAATLLTAQAAAPEVEITNEPHHHLTFENKSVRVFNVEVDPNAETLTHWHRHDYIAIALGPAEVTNVVKDKPPVILKFQDGETRFTPATFAHFVRDTGPQPFRNVTIEILEDANLRNSNAIWDPAKNEDRALDILEGGTKQILFVKDNVRVSEFELQPNVTIQTTPHPHPTLLVAITDLTLYIEDPRTHGSHQPAPKPHHLDVGASTWLPFGFNPLTNAGPQIAKFVTLEFP